MPKKILNKRYGFHTLFFIIFSIVLVALLTYYRWIFGVIGIIILLILIFTTYQAEIAFKQYLRQYIETITYRVKKAGTDVINHLPIGIILYDEEKKIEWHNQYLNIIADKEQITGKYLLDIIPALNLENDVQKIKIGNNDRIYQVDIKSKERLLFLTDITDYTTLLEQHRDERAVFGIIHLDNLDEVGQGMDELSRSLLLTDVTSNITDWANDLGIYLKRFTADKFFFVTNQYILEQLKKSRFDILDIVREITTENKIPLTLSIGIGAGIDSLIKLGESAQSSLDIALGRGGDQAAVKEGEGLSFYGGKTNAVEKRTRVRARVISHALKDIIKGSDTVLIMGHQNPDMDAIGAALGILKTVSINERDGYIILNESNPMISNLIDEIDKQKDLTKHFITSENGLNLITAKTLLILVDTHKPSLTIEPKLIDKIEKTVVIDHHRRGEEIIEDPVLIYIEPYASSTSELVTELLQYQNENLVMERIEATALLAGIYVDTKNFAFRTGTRTFEAASFLRTKGADTSLVQKLLKEDLNQYILKSEIVKKAEIKFDNVAIAISDEKLDQILIAKAADTLLNINGVLASFVISVRPDDLVAISARSSGQINVQVIMERLGGGGHLTNAAVQLEGVTLGEAERRLVEVLQSIQQEGGLKI